MTWANVAMTLALVFAMAGGAYAAGSALTGKQKKEVIKIAKKYAGKNGAPGAQGPAGEKGPAGPAGAAGAKGENGAPGEKGATGPQGEKGATGPQGLAGTNGATGPKGPTGPVGPTGEEGAPGAAGPTGPSGFGETLPVGKTERGSFFVAGKAAAAGEVFTAMMSFALPLPVAPTNEHFVTESEQIKKAVPAECTVGGKEGSVEEPLAQPGELCVFESVKLNMEVEPFGFFTGPPGKSFGRSGVALNFESKASGTARMGGTWAVTA